MIRSWMVAFVCCAVPCSMLAQCQVGGPNPSVPIEILASAIGQKGLGGNAFTMMAVCPGDTNAHVKFKLDTTVDSSLIVSPSSGTTPVEIQVGVDPNRVGNWFPVQVTRYLHFTTVDQTPPATPSVIVRVTLTTPDPPVIRSVVNAASLAPVVTPGAVVLIRGTSLGPNMSATLDQTGLYPTTLGNTTVTFNGIPAPLLSASPLVIKAVAPYGLAGQASAQVVVTHYPQSTAEQVSATFSVPVAETALAIFTRTQTGSGQGDIENCDADGCTPNGADNPAAPGSIITFFATGTAARTGPKVDGAVGIVPRLYQPVSVTIGGQPAAIRYAGVAPYRVWGVFQVNAVVPEGIGSGPQPVVLTVEENNNSQQNVTVAVR